MPGMEDEAEAENQLPPPEHLRVPLQQQRASTPTARKTSYESLM